MSGTKNSGKGKKSVFKRWLIKKLGCCDYSRLCIAISKFPWLRTDMLNFGILFSISTSQISIEWGDNYIPGFEIYANNYIFTEGFSRWKFT